MIDTGSLSPTDSGRLDGTLQPFGLKGLFLGDELAAVLVATYEIALLLVLLRWQLL